jgi:hypothetical protein
MATLSFEAETPELVAKARLASTDGNVDAAPAEVVGRSDAQSATVFQMNQAVAKQILKSLVPRPAKSTKT